MTTTGKCTYYPIRQQRQFLLCAKVTRQHQHDSVIQLTNGVPEFIIFQNAFCSHHTASTSKPGVRNSAAQLAIRISRRVQKGYRNLRKNLPRFRSPGPLSILLCMEKIKSMITFRPCYPFRNKWPPNEKGQTEPLELTSYTKRPKPVF